MNAFKNLSLLVVCLLICASVFGEPTNGPLQVCPDNPRYFADQSGEAVLLTGSHVWYNLVDMGPGDPPPVFDYEKYLDWMTSLNHNFMRMWTWEMVAWDTEGNNPKNRNENTFHTVHPSPWKRTGPGIALDGKPRFDLTAFNPDYFKRLRERVTAARDRGIYVSIMLFEGWAMQRIEGGFKYHPFHPSNNKNGINADANGDGKGLEAYELVIPAVTAIQEAFVKKVIDTVNDLDNVLYEISNENHPESTEWQYHMINFIHNYEKDKPAQHPVGMTFQFKGGANQTLFDSPAEWISPNNEGGYRDNPPDGKGKKVILTDTDHLWGIGGNMDWVWKSVCRGMNPIFMDPYDGIVLGKPFDPQWEPIRNSMGYALRYAEKMNLTAMTPHYELASSEYCLANPGSEYLIYLPTGNEVTVDLSGAETAYTVEWFSPLKAQFRIESDIKGGASRTLKSPFGEEVAVLYLSCVEK